MKAAMQRVSDPMLHCDLGSKGMVTRLPGQTVSCIGEAEFNRRIQQASTRFNTQSAKPCLTGPLEIESAGIESAGGPLTKEITNERSTYADETSRRFTAAMSDYLDSRMGA